MRDLLKNIIFAGSIYGAIAMWLKICLNFFPHYFYIKRNRFRGSDLRISFSKMRTTTGYNLTSILAKFVRYLNNAHSRYGFILRATEKVYRNAAIRQSIEHTDNKTKYPLLAAPFPHPPPVTSEVMNSMPKTVGKSKH